MLNEQLNRKLRLNETKFNGEIAKKSPSRERVRQRSVERITSEMQVVLLAKLKAE